MHSICFGKYYISEKYKKEPIEWLILEKDEEHGRALLLSKYILDYKQFDTTYMTSWSVSKLREWLNNDFLKEAFNKEEQNIIKTTKI